MPNKNQSKSDKKTKKYKQRRAQLLAEVAQLKKENEEQSKKSEKEYEELRNLFKKTDKKIEEVAELQKETGKEVKEVVEGLRQVRIASEYHGEQIGGLGNKLGGYTEAMAIPSIRGILERQFDADFKGWLGAGGTKYKAELEVDAWGVSRNGTSAAYIVEIKSRFRKKHIKQVWKLVKRFRIHKSKFRARAVYPMLAVVDISDKGRAMVWNAGIHLIEINDGVFRYAMPPQDFEADGYHGMPGVRKDMPHLRAVPSLDQNRRDVG